jgi:aldehyde dehydrogenase (NAD+)
MTSVPDLNNMSVFFDSGATQSYEFRKQQLLKLKSVVEKYELEIYKALYSDLKKSPEECWVTENGMLLSEINNAISQLQHWMKPKKVPTNLLNFPSSSYIYPEPLGVVLIISPWNYPFQLLLKPAVGTIAAGNCLVLKSSEHAPASSALLYKMISETFDSKYIQLIEGDGATIIPELMNNFVFDHVLFTGSTVVGKSIYKLAAEKLMPVTLELGGKSPCIVEADADIEIAVKRIAVTKFSNAGQMCVAPDYILVHDTVKEKFIAALKKTLQKFYTDNPSETNHYGKIINEKQFDRLVSYLQDGTVIYGGKHNRQTLFIEPTLLTNVDLNSPLMNEEIFGPLLPIVTFSTFEEARKIISQNKNPLAFYLFTASRKKEAEWLQQIPFGGGCINNTSWHLTNHHLPFGGRGFSGIGAYHGKFSFNTFSHHKSILKTPTWFDPFIKYPPFKGRLGLLKKLFKF